MKIVNIKKGNHQEVYDISVADCKHYVLENGIVSHNSGISYNPNTILQITKAQEKDGKELKGYKFTLVTEKSRFIKPMSRIPLYMSFEDGIDNNRTLFDLARELGYITNSGSWYEIRGVEGKRQKTELLKDDELWQKLLKDGLDADIESFYKL